MRLLDPDLRCVRSLHDKIHRIRRNLEQIFAVQSGEITLGSSLHHLYLGMLFSELHKLRIIDARRTASMVSNPPKTNSFVFFLKKHTKIVQFIAQLSHKTVIAAVESVDGNFLPRKSAPHKIAPRTFRIGTHTNITFIPCVA